MSDVQSGRGLSPNQAREAGLNTAAYAWKDVPEGTWEATLDFKVWGAIQDLVCFFSSIPDGQKYRLSAFSPKERSRVYTPRDGETDMSESGLDGKRFLLDVGSTSKGTTKWKSAKLLD